MKNTSLISNKYFVASIVFLILSIIFVSCKKNKSTTDDNSLRIFVIENTKKLQRGTVSISWNNNQMLVDSFGREIISNDTKVTLTATPSTGYIFGGWGNGLSGNNEVIEFTMNGSKVVSAKFIKVYSLDLQPTTGGTIKAYQDTTKGIFQPFDDQTSIPENTKVYLIATPDPGQDLLTWTDTTSENSLAKNTALKTSFVMKNQHQISATFVASHTFTYNNPTITSNGVDSFQASRYSAKIWAFRDPLFTDTISNGSKVAQGLNIYAKAILPDVSFDPIWDINGTQIHHQSGQDTASFKMPTTNADFKANIQQQGYEVTITVAGAATTLKYKYGAIKDFTDYHNTTSGNTFKFPRGYMVTLQATSNDASTWKWSTNVTSVLNTEKEQQVPIFINDVSQLINLTRTPI